MRWEHTPSNEPRLAVESERPSANRVRRVAESIETRATDLHAACQFGSNQLGAELAQQIAVLAHAVRDLAIALNHTQDDAR